MDQIEVTTLQTHLGQYGIKKVGDKYTTSKLHAAELKAKGLVSADVDAVKEPQEGKVLVSDKVKEKVESKSDIPEKKEIKKPGK